MKKVYFVTGNQMKVLVAQKALETNEIELEQVKIETPEIQSMDVKEVASFSAEWAANKLNKPVVKEDNAFCIEALDEFPGTFVAHIDKTIGENGIMKLMNGIKNRKAKYVLAVSYCVPGGQPIVEFEELEGVISENLEGEYGWFSDKFFIPNGYGKTMGCYPDDERKMIWPHNFWKKLATRILSEKNDGF